MDSQTQGLAGSLQIRSTYSAQVKMGVPVEIVDDDSHQVLSGEPDRPGAEEGMEMMDAEHTVASHLSHHHHHHHHHAISSSQLSSLVSQLTSSAGTLDHRQLAGAGMGVPSSQLSSTVSGGGGGNGVGGGVTGSGGGGGGTSADNMDGSRLSSSSMVNQQLQQQAAALAAHFQQRRSPPLPLALSLPLSSAASSLDITSADATLAQAESLITQMVKAAQSAAGAGTGGGGGAAGEVRRALAGMTYGDLDMGEAGIIATSMRASVSSMLGDGGGGGVGGGASGGGMGGGRGGGNGGNGSSNNNGDDPSSPESNFDSSELLNMTMLQQDDVTARLVAAGPIGVAAAAAVLTSRKRKRSHAFESNPAIRKRHCSKLLRRLKDLVEELSARVGLQAVVVTYRPGKTDPKEDPTYKVFGAAPLTTVLRNHRDMVVADMEAALSQQALPALPSLLHPKGGVGGVGGGGPGVEALHELPPLVFDGIPTPVNKMTQAQLRAFIPNMLKFSTGRGKPGWGKDDMRPPWWPEEVAWANVRSDTRTEEQKKALSWTDALRKIVLSCYQFHNRIDLLPDASEGGVAPPLDDLQLQMSQLQQGGGVMGGGGGGVVVGGSGVVVEGDEEVDALAAAAAAAGHASSDLMGGDGQQVFTIDTGIGSCDTSGMPTLADATLAEAAARLQQMADETGQVQYATQTVTVTERDAKALGQPVGTTTTVLLTAYPGGHNGNGLGGVPDASQQYLSPPPSNSPSHVPNVQVVYNASHIDDIPDSIVSTISSDQLGMGGAGGVTSHHHPHHHHHHSSDMADHGLGASSSEYLTPTTTELIISGGGVGDSRSGRVVGGGGSLAEAIGAQLGAQASISSADIASHLSAAGVSHEDIAAQLISEYTNSSKSLHSSSRKSLDGHARISGAI